MSRNAISFHRTRIIIIYKHILTHSSITYVSAELRRLLPNSVTVVWLFCAGKLMMKIKVKKQRKYFQMSKTMKKTLLHVQGGSIKLFTSFSCHK